MSLISGPGLHRLPSRQQLAADLKACNRGKDAATVAAIKYATEVAELQQQLDVAGIRISGLLYDAEEAQREIDGLRAALANATSVTAPASQRGIALDDQPTNPTGTNVRPLWDALGIIPGNTSPAHVPGGAS